MEETFFNDYLEGKYPNYDSKMLANDLAFAVYSRLHGSSFCAILLTPKLYDSDVFPYLGETLKSVFGHEIVLKKDLHIGEHELYNPDDHNRYYQIVFDLKSNLF